MTGSSAAARRTEEKEAPVGRLWRGSRLWAVGPAAVAALVRTAVTFLCVLVVAGVAAPAGQDE